MPPTGAHAPDGIPKTLHPSSHVASLLETLRHLTDLATRHGFCPVAATAYAAQQQSHHPVDRLPPQQFQMGLHTGHGPRGSHPCNCVTQSNNSTHRDRRKRHQPHPPPHKSSAEHTTPHKPPLIDDLRKELQNLDDDASKMALARDTMMSRYKRSKTLELENNVRRLYEDQYKRITTTGTVLTPSTEAAADQILGCRHYARRCKLKANCCGLFVACRFCHDEAMAEDHEMDRFATEKVLCMLCMTEQHVTKTCVQCKTDFAHYFCTECRFYDNTPGKKVYHCERCHICRLGEGLGIDNFHCDNCDACVSLPSKPYHRCTSKALHSNCPVCRGYLFTSTEPVVFMRCGHTMHSKCFDDYTTGSYQCPLCMKSLTDMQEYFDQIDEVVRAEPMPEEYANKRSIIFCSDCHTKSKVEYHFMYHKCANRACNSYNTKVLNVLDEEDGLDDHNNTREQQRQPHRTADYLTQSTGNNQEAASSSSAMGRGESLETSVYYSSDGRVDGGDELASADDGQFSQPIESTV